MDKKVEAAPVPDDKQLQKMLQNLAQFMALYEQADDRLKIQKEQMDNQLAAVKQELQTQVTSMSTVLNDMKEVMTAAGAARWRVAAEKAMQDGEAHLVSIKEATNVYKKLAEDSVTRLEHVSAATEKRISSALYRLNEENSGVVEDFRRRSEEACLQLDDTVSDTISTIKRLLRWMRIDRITIAIIAGLLSAFLTSLYINAEWPWESFHNARQERLVGESILTVWPTLSPDKQNQINQLLGRKIQ